MKNTLRRFDDVLTADERFRLALAAMARDDDAEVERLHKTCPRLVYTMTDADFTDRFQGSRVVAVDFMVIWLWSHKQYSEAHWLVAIHERAMNKGITTMTRNEAFDLLIRRGEELRGAYAGYLRFCTAARLDWRTLLQWWPPILDEIEAVRFLLDDDVFDTSEEVAGIVYGLLTSAWRGSIDAPAVTGDAA